MPTAPESGSTHVNKLNFFQVHKMSCQVESAQNRNVRFKRNIRKRSSSLLPFVRWLLNYSQMDVLSDIITGITIGLIIIPQSVAYVAIVGLSAKVRAKVQHRDHYLPSSCYKYQNFHTFRWD